MNTVCSGVLSSSEGNFKDFYHVPFDIKMITRFTFICNKKLLKRRKDTEIIKICKLHLDSILYVHTPGIQKHVTVLNTRNGTKVYIGMIKGELYLFSNNKQCGHLPTANVYIHIEYYF